MKYRLLSAIIGDICGSSYECCPELDYNKVNLTHIANTYTDDTICTIAIADALLNPCATGVFDFTHYLRKWYFMYPDCGYGKNYKTWASNVQSPIQYSWGNGAAMRISPIGFYAKSIGEARILAHEACLNSHAHLEGIKGAIAVAESVFRMKESYDFWVVEKNIMLDYYPEYRYKDLNKIKETYKFDSSCQGTVPIAMLCFNDSVDYKDCITKAISMGGDADTLAAIAGSIMGAHLQELPEDLVEYALSKLTPEMIDIIERFDLLIDEREQD